MTSDCKTVDTWRQGPEIGGVPSIEKIDGEGIVTHVVVGSSTARPPGTFEQQSFFGLYNQVQIARRELLVMETRPAEQVAETLRIFTYLTERDLLNFQPHELMQSELKFIMLRLLDQLRMILSDESDWTSPTLLPIRKKLIHAYLGQKQELDKFDPLALSEEVLNLLKE